MNVKAISYNQLIIEIKKRLEAMQILSQKLDTISKQKLTNHVVSINLDSYNKVEICDNITRDIVKRAAKIQLKNMILENKGSLVILQKELNERTELLYGN